MTIQEFLKQTDDTGNSETMPVIFAGHGSPMNAIEQNEFSLQWNTIGKQIPIPRMILCISAHWETRGTFITAMEHPPTIHDFGGFPQALYEVQYPAPGSPVMAKEVSQQLNGISVGMDNSWGLDHGTWSVLVHMFPHADIPVLQLSLDYQLSPAAHYELARQLAGLRDKGVLILGSGNIVHNLRLLDWNHPDSGSDWAIEANGTMKKLIDQQDHKQLIGYKELGKAVQLAVPTPEHYLPLLYALALQKKNEPLTYFNEKAVMGSLTMTSLLIGQS